MLNTGMGINQIVNANLGNPAPLAKKVEQSQQGQQGQPGKLPLDLKYALALQEIDALKKAASNQQSLQAGGEQPTVVDKLEQMLKGDSEQAQPQQGGPNEPAPFNPQQAAQGQPPQGMLQGMPQGMPPQMAQRPPMPQMPVRAAHGGGIDRLMANLGRHYDKGGIVAFAEAGEVEDPSFERPSVKDEIAALNASETPEDRARAEVMARRIADKFKPEEGIKAAAPRTINVGGQKFTEQAPLQAPEQYVPAPPTALENTIRERNKVAMTQDPEAARAAEQQRYKTEVGLQDFSSNEQLIKELQAKRARQTEERANRPWYKSDFISGLAAAKPGQKWTQAGAAASAYEDAAKKAYEEGDFAALKEILGAQASLSEAKRGSRKELFEKGAAETTRVRKAAEDAAKALGESEENIRKAGDKAAQDHLKNVFEASKGNYEATGKFTELGIKTAQHLQDMASRAADRRERIAEVKDRNQQVQLQRFSDQILRAETAAEKLKDFKYHQNLETMQQSGPDSKAYKEAKAANDAVDKNIESMIRPHKAIFEAKLKALYPDLIPVAGSSDAAPAVSLPPMDELVNGKVYDTPRGKAKWNKATKQFEAV
jgi:hypothetical protein